MITKFILAYVAVASFAIAVLTELPPSPRQAASANCVAENAAGKTQSFQ
jgi:hypothetical protein